MKFSIKFLGIIALSDATQAAFIPATTNTTTNVARADSTKKTGGPEFPVKVRRSCIPTIPRWPLRRQSLVVVVVVAATTAVPLSPGLIINMPHLVVLI
jgi:hypothetical protein